MNMKFSGWENAQPVLDEDDPARSELIEVTLVRKTCISTWNSVLRCLIGHYFSWKKFTLWDDVLRTKIALKDYEIIQETQHRQELIWSLLLSK